MKKLMMTSLLTAVISFSAHASEFCPPLSAISCTGDTCKLSDEYTGIWHIDSVSGQPSIALATVVIRDDIVGVQCMYGETRGNYVEVTTDQTFKPNTAAAGNRWDGTYAGFGVWICNRWGGKVEDCPMIASN